MSQEVHAVADASGGGTPRAVWWYRSGTDPAGLITPEDQARLRHHVELIARDGGAVAAEDPAAVIDASAGAQVVISGWGAPTYGDDVLAACPDLRLFVRLGGSLRIGFEGDRMVVGPSAWERGVKVSTAGEAQGQLMADLVLALILAGLHQFPLYGRHQWGVEPLRRDHGLAWPQRTLHTRTVGLDGFGAIGRHVARLLAPWACTVLVYDPFVAPETVAAYGATAVASLSELCARSDVLVPLVPAGPVTNRSIGAAELAALRDGSLVVNISWGEIVDLDALEAELRRGRLAACFDNAPVEAQGHPERLRYLPHFFLTPSISGFSDGVARLMGRQVVDEVVRFVRGQPLHHEVRPEHLRHRA
jgi:phosphoglycerate dehydrogenase-like enzyme